MVVVFVIAGCKGSQGNRPDAGPGGPPDASVDAMADGPSDAALDAPHDGGAPVVCAPLMAPRITSPVPPSTVAVADVNGDGKPDLVFTLRGDSSADPVVGPSLNVMLGNGDGSYQPARRTVLDPDPSVSFGPPSLADLDGDGDLDVVIKSTDVQLVLGDGQGNFTLGDHFAAPGGALRLGDLDLDGHVDIALSGDGVTLVFGTGGGNFAAPVSLDTTSVYQALEIADVNGDHIPDLVAAGSSLAVFRGRGDRTFEAPVKATPVGDGLHGLAVGDLDGDGLADIVTSGLVSSTGTVTVETWLGAADGSLTRRGQLSLFADHRTDLPPPVFVPLLAVGDFDRDTMLDVAVTYANRDVIYLIKGNGTGDLTSSTQVATDRGVGAITSADADGDGRLDLIVANTAIDVLLATPDGFRAPFEIRRFSDFIDHHGSTVLFAAGDLDGDGKLDFVDGSLDVDLERDVEAIEVAPLSGGGSGGRHDLGPSEGVIGVQAIVLRDIDGDGDLDILASRSATVTVFFNPGNGQFGPGVQYPPDPVMIGTGFAVGDVDGDHRPDFVVSGQIPGTSNFLIRVMRNDGAGNFSSLSSFPGTAVRLLHNFNGDGRDDLVNNVSSTAMEVRLSNGDGTFAPPIPIDLGAVAADLVATDFDGDGVPDLVAETGGQTVFLHGNGDGTFTTAGTAPIAPGGLIAVANIDNIPPLDLVGHNGIVYRAGSDTRTETWSMYATDVRDTNGDGHPDVLGMGFHGLFDAPRTHAAFVLVNPCH
ncbi:MAG TPA: VCBS repeat-containing protein [Kofleriaceae bacterium]|nr:VCBS repeat-containing protein [Kofleriaceae bacterium]